VLGGRVGQDTLSNARPACGNSPSDGHDRCYALSYFVKWLVTDLYGHDRDERETRIRAYARGERPTGIPDTAAALITRYAPLTTPMTDFFHRLGEESRQNPYPWEQLRGLAL
jgi:hypothetical protein